jgi:hypothetical protein
LAEEKMEEARFAHEILAGKVLLLSLWFAGLLGAGGLSSFPRRRPAAGSLSLARASAAVGLKIDAEALAADHAVEVAFHRAEIVDLLIKTRKLGGEVNGKALGLNSLARHCLLLLKLFIRF